MADIRRRTNSDGSIGYQVRYIDKSKKSGFGFKTFGKSKLAQKFKAEKELEEQNTGEASSIASVPEAVAEWLHICERQGTSKRDEPVTAYTLKQYQHFGAIICRYSWKKNLRQLTTPDIVTFKGWLLENCASQDQAKRVLAALSTAMNEMALRGIINSNVASGVSIRSDSRYKSEVEIPSEAEVLALLAAADRLANSKNKQISDSWERYRPMLYLAADSGMRPQEYMAIPSFNLRDDGYYVDRAIERPGNRISVTKTPSGCRLIPASKFVSDMLKHYLHNNPIPNSHGLIFPTRSGRWQSIDNWRKRGYYKACEDAGLMIEVENDDGIFTKPKYTPYALRHYYASSIIDQGLDLKRIQKRMGHASIETTLNVYGHLIERREVAEADRTGLIGLLHSSEKSCGVGVAQST